MRLLAKILSTAALTAITSTGAILVAGATAQPARAAELPSALRVNAAAFLDHCDGTTDVTVLNVKGRNTYKVNGSAAFTLDDSTDPGKATRSFLHVKPTATGKVTVEARVAGDDDKVELQEVEAKDPIKKIGKPADTITHYWDKPAGCTGITEVTATPTVAATTNMAPYYASCDAVRRAGKAPLHRDQPGYRKALDADGDGTACDASPAGGHPAPTTTSQPKVTVGQPTALALTGSPTGRMAGLGLLLLVSGGLAITLATRRRRTRFQP